MEKRKQIGWIAVVVVAVVSLVMIPAFFRTGRQEAGSGPYLQQSAQPALPVAVRPVEYRSPQPTETVLLLYPNPVRYTLHVVVPQKYAAPVWLAIYDANGQLWKKYATESGRVIEINVQALPAGNYLLKVGGRQGRTWLSRFFKT